MDIQREEFELTFQKTSFCKNMVKSLENSDCPFTSVFEMRNGKYRSSYVQLSFEIWQAAKAQAVPEGFVLIEKAKLMQIIGSVSMIEPITRGNPYMDSVKRELTAITDVVKTVIEPQEPAK